MEETKIYEADEFSSKMILHVIKEVSEILKERGYNPINQITGYLMSGDPGYITNYKNARTMILEFDRSKIIEVFLKKII